MSMPVTSAYLDNLLSRSKGEVRLSRKVLSVEAITIAHGMNEVAHSELGLGILGADTRHIPAALLYGLGHSFLPKEGSCVLAPAHHPCAENLPFNRLPFRFEPVVFIQDSICPYGHSLALQMQVLCAAIS